MEKLEFIFFNKPSREKMKIKKILVKKILELDNVIIFYKHNIIKDYYIYSFYSLEKLIYTTKENYLKLLKAFDSIENDDIFYSDNLVLENYNNYHNIAKKFKSKNINNVRLVKDKNLTLVDNLKNHHYSKNPSRTEKFLGLDRKFLNFFNYIDIHQKVNLENIEKEKLPHYRLIKKDKYNLLDILANHSLNFNLEEINYYLLHDSIPFINYESLKNHLEKYHNKEKNTYYTKFEKDSEAACKYLLAKNNVIILEEKNGFNVYTKEKIEDVKNLDEGVKNYIEKIKAVDNDFLIPYNNMSNKDLINIEFLHDKISISKNKKYHHGFYSNGIYKSSLNIDKEEIKDIDKEKIEIKILDELEKDFYTILIKVNRETIELNYFYIPMDKLILTRNMIEKMWKRGCFLKHFGKANYLNTDTILESQLIVPEWLYSDDLKSFRKLTKIISNIK